MVHRLLIFLAVVATVLPIIYVLGQVGGPTHWKGVPPQGITDSLYYYARLHEVSDGHPLVGNPFVYEYRDSNSPGSFLPDILSAVPFLIGLPFTASIIVNLFVWTLLFFFILKKLLTELKVDTKWLVPIIMLVYVSSYAFMMRPTVMQIIYPLFLFFLLTFLQFLHEPLSRRRAIWLAVASALAFYFYNFLGFFVFVSCACVFLWFLVSKKSRELYACIVMGLYTVILLIPFAIYSRFQLNGSLYKETLVRIGLTETHIPPVEAFFFGRWVVFGLIAFLIATFYLYKREGHYLEQRIFWVITGGALLICLFLNVFIGVEFTIAIHMGRFVITWAALIFGVLLYEWYKAYFCNHKKVLWTHVAMGLFMLVLASGVARNIPRAIGFFSSDNREVSYRNVQEYAGPLLWLEKNVTEESVVWSNKSISGYIPVMTKHYPLFLDSATAHTIPNEELEERYLLWRSLGDLTLKDVKNDFGMYAGAGREKELPLAINNRVRLCNMVAKLVDTNCPQKTDAITLQGEDYFNDLLAKFNDVKRNRARLLSEYNVGYIIVDSSRDAYASLFSTSTAIYTDGTFSIYLISNVPLE